MNWQVVRASGSSQNHQQRLVPIWLHQWAACLAQHIANHTVVVCCDRTDSSISLCVLYSLLTSLKHHSISPTCTHKLAARWATIILRQGYTMLFLSFSSCGINVQEDLSGCNCRAQKHRQVQAWLVYIAACRQQSSLCSTCRHEIYMQQSTVKRRVTACAAAALSLLTCYPWVLQPTAQQRPHHCLSNVNMLHCSGSRHPLTTCCLNCIRNSAFRACLANSQHRPVSRCRCCCCCC
jgi:hypothetical protein